MDVAKVRLFDLSQVIYHGCPAYPKMAVPQITRTSHRVREGYNAETMTVSTHLVTHVDTPEHFYDGTGDSATLPLERCWGPGVFIDARGKVGPDEPVGLTMLMGSMDLISEGDFVLINTGWCRRRGFEADYMRAWPYLDGEGAAALRDKKVKAVGIDSLSLGGYGSKEKARPCHEILLGAGILILEEVFFPEEVMDGKKRLVSAFPLKIAGASASPVRLVAYDF
ncbi:MAG: cyclase family protein [Deltaproteobacteria bacterium]|jgi:kynurenine formamidase|nr:cyclase family protein [Deltaproteobacteria bacterium]